MSQAVDSITNEHVLEIRYKPNPKVLDHRGTWAEEISRHMELSEWRIVENRIDIFSKTQDVHAFVGFRNAGLVARDTPTANFFPDKAVKLLRCLFSLEGFGDPSRLNDSESGLDSVLHSPAHSRRCGSDTQPGS